MVILQPALVAPQALLEPLGRRLEAAVGIVALALGLKVDAGIQVDRELGTKGLLALLDGHMPGVAVLEIFLQHRDDALVRAFTQAFAHINVLADHA